MNVSPSPEALRHQAERLLQAHALEDGDAASLVRILTRATLRHLATGEALCREGEASTELYFLLEGRILVLKDDHHGHEREIGTWFAPAMVGALGVAAAGDGPVPRSATCVAGAPSVVAVLDGPATAALLRDPGAEGATLRWILLASFTEVLASTTERLRELLAKPPAAANLTATDLAYLQAALQGLKKT